MTPVVIVTGSRKWPESKAEVICAVLRELDPMVVVEGGADGADTIAREWAKANKRIPVTVDADWDRYDLAAGAIRNSLMLREYPKAVVIAFPLGISKGTRDCIRKAKARRMDVRVYEGTE